MAALKFIHLLRGFLFESSWPKPTHGLHLHVRMLARTHAEQKLLFPHQSQALEDRLQPQSKCGDSPGPVLAPWATMAPLPCPAFKGLCSLASPRQTSPDSHGSSSHCLLWPGLCSFFFFFYTWELGEVEEMTRWLENYIIIVRIVNTHFPPEMSRRPWFFWTCFHHREGFKGYTSAGV